MNLQAIGDLLSSKEESDVLIACDYLEEVYGLHLVAARIREITADTTSIPHEGTVIYRFWPVMISRENFFSEEFRDIGSDSFVKALDQWNSFIKEYNAQKEAHNETS